MRRTKNKRTVAMENERKSKTEDNSKLNKQRTYRNLLGMWPPIYLWMPDAIIYFIFFPMFLLFFLYISIYLSIYK